MDYVIWVFRGTLDGRPTRCSATRSCLVIIKVFRFQRKTLLLFFGFFFFIIIIIIIIIIFLLLTPFLKNAWTDFHEIFRDGVYWSRKTENNFSCDDVTSGPRNRRFSDFQGVVLFRDLLRNDSRYLLQIFTDGRQKIEVV